METAVPESAVNVGSGVYAARGGYQEIGRSIELPTVSGGDTNITQDSEGGDDTGLVVTRMFFNDTDDAPVRKETVTHGNKPVPTPPAREVPVQPVVPPNPPPPSSLAKPDNDIVDSVGGSVGESPQGDILKPEQQDTIEDLTVTGYTADYGIISDTSTGPDRISVSLEGTDSGLEVSTNFDVVIITEPVNSVVTIVLGTSDNRSLMLPPGQYNITVNSEDTYSALFGSQTFEHGLRYYIFVSN